MLRAIREERGRTREAVAVAAGMTLSALQKLETARTHEPGWQTVVSILDFLEHPLDDFERRRRADSPNRTPDEAPHAGR
ncbi:helix-turn-helix transcriptional regulator [Curtobacterium sp. RHCJP20]|uniref:Helix-turn-helix transcriptional regulator n=1 Tax=Curtobacterium subtropicum TaxID=3055138 RepID=A0ABT7TDN8_9MICO|nr:helix-turn-helix transcriptional regulator [Curtobacterium subtropicum]MDM7887693.1 helix-turn-helix transcriptional regulator [Curtobacterium subtropicum]